MAKARRMTKKPPPQMSELHVLHMFRIKNSRAHCVNNLKSIFALFVIKYILTFIF